MNFQPKDYSPRYKIFVGGINGETKECIVWNFFKSRYPSLINFEMPFKDEMKRICKGYCILTLRSEVEFNDLITVRDFNLQGRTIHTKPFYSGQQLKYYKKNLESKRLFVKPVPNSWSREHITSFFSVFGAIEDAYIIENSRTGKSKGYGFVLFESEKDAKALLRFNLIKIFNFFIRVRKCESKKKRSNFKFLQRRIVDYLKIYNIPEWIKFPSPELILGNDINKIMKENQRKINSYSKMPSFESSKSSWKFNNSKPCSLEDIYSSPKTLYLNEIMSQIQHIKPTSSKYYMYREEILENHFEVESLYQKFNVSHINTFRKISCKFF